MLSNLYYLFQIVFKCKKAVYADMLSLQYANNRNPFYMAAWL